jgi:hypothetical protein
VAAVQFSRTAEKAKRARHDAVVDRRAPVSQNSTACAALDRDGMPRCRSQIRSTFQAGWSVVAPPRQHAKVLTGTRRRASRVPEGTP